MLNYKLFLNMLKHLFILFSFFTKFNWLWLTTLLTLILYFIVIVFVYSILFLELGVAYLPAYVFTCWILFLFCIYFIQYYFF